ncbi:fibronectin type III domain-containing protein 11 [Eublepharis macularius]|uniref:Fibronectin type III domain-containing protein 11 n=1 Tax=Eublepharis macularius TaxID=481883 RepID=A0AA97JDB6_EUBMA|nr:fibronectin type III domain-containing protein 11 [Eublepharis macularius]
MTSSRSHVRKSGIKSIFITDLAFPLLLFLSSPGIMNIGTIDVYLNKTGSSLQTMVYSEEEQENDAWNMYTERKNIVLEFLCSDLSLHLLKRHHKRIELLKKCSYYIEILPKHLALGDQNHLMLPTTMFQLIDPWRFQRMKKVGSIQTKIQLLLLSELLEQLERGREELVQFLETYDVMTFLSRWDVIRQRLSSLSEQMDHFLALLVPGRLHIKHRLVSDVGVTKIPHIRLVIITKMPVMFDRKESAAHLDWVSLRWFVSSQQPQVEQYELRFKLLEPRAPQDKIHCGIMAVTSNTCEIHNLQPDRLYRFTIKRAEIYTLVYEQWRDSILLKTKPYPEEDMESAMSEPHLSHLSNTQGM